MPYGPWKGQNVYEIISNQEAKIYVAGSWHAAKRDLAQMESGDYVIPFGQSAGLKFSQLNENKQNYFKYGTEQRISHFGKALAISNTTQENTPIDNLQTILGSRVTEPSYTHRRERIEGFYNKHELAQLTGLKHSTVKTYMNKANISPDSYFRIPGNRGPKASYWNKESVIKFIDLVLYENKDFR